MAYTPIRWDNINIPTFASANRAYEAGARMLAGAFSGFGGVLDERSEEVTKRNTDKVIADIYGLKDSQTFANDADQLVASAGDRVDLSRILDARSGRRTDLLNFAKADQEASFNQNFRDTFAKLRTGVSDGSIGSEEQAINLMFDSLNPQTPEQATYIRSVVSDLYQPTHAEAAKAAADAKTLEHKRKKEIEWMKKNNSGKGFTGSLGLIADTYEGDPTDNYKLAADQFVGLISARNGVFRWNDGEGINNNKAGEAKVTDSELQAAIQETLAGNFRNQFWVPGTDPNLPLADLKKALYRIIQSRPVTAKTESQDPAEKRAAAAKALDESTR